MLVPNRVYDIPEETAQVARAAFPKGNLLLTLRDEFGPLFEDEAFAELYPAFGQPAEIPGRLALVTVLQFMEQKTDREAMRRALDELAAMAPEWLLAHMKPGWGERYSRRLDTHRIRKNKTKMQSLATTIGRDGCVLLQAVYDAGTLSEIRALPTI